LKKVSKSFQYGEHTVTLETGEIARQADAAIIASMEDTVVLVTVVGAKSARPGQDFFPLTVDYQEKVFAAGRIPGGFFRREGRPSEKEILICRLIDRPMRPLFPKGYVNEVQIICTVISINPDIDPDIIAMLGTSAALATSGLPFNGPVACARVGYIDGEYVLNPGAEALKDSDLNLVVAGTESAVLMVESEAKVLSEEVMLGSVMYGHEQSKIAIKAIRELAAEVNTDVREFVAAEKDEALAEKVSAIGKVGFEEAYSIAEKMSRQDKCSSVRSLIMDELTNEESTSEDIEKISGAIKGLEKSIVRGRILDGQPRIDGRGTRTIRPITIRTGVLPRTDGSALFTRVKPRHWSSPHSVRSVIHRLLMRWKGVTVIPSCCITISRPTRLVKRAE